MKLQRKGTRHSHRGVIGVESAIVMIAFVIVAAALAFVVLNMGFSTSQKAKTTIIAGLEESGSSMQLSGKVTAVGCISTGTCSTTAKLNNTVFPIKVTSGGESVDLAAATTAIKYLSNSIEYDDIYSGPLTTSEYRSPALAYVGVEALTGSGYSNWDGIDGDGSPSSTSAFIYWAVRSNTNAILDQGEHANLVVGYDISNSGSTDERPAQLDNIRIEIIPATGASLSAERQVPVITTTIVDLG